MRIAKVGVKSQLQEVMIGSMLRGTLFVMRRYPGVLFYRGHLCVLQLMESGGHAFFSTTSQLQSNWGSEKGIPTGQSLSIELELS